MAMPTFASVTFDPTTGAGFVGKGDVQTAFGWNNQALQANAADVTFSYNAVDTYSATCSWITGVGLPASRRTTSTFRGTWFILHMIALETEWDVRALKCETHPARVSECRLGLQSPACRPGVLIESATRTEMIQVAAPAKKVT